MLLPLERLGELERLGVLELLVGVVLLGVVDGRLLLLEGEVVVGRLLRLGVLTRLLLLLDGDVELELLDERDGEVVTLLFLDEEEVVVVLWLDLAGAVTVDALLELLVGDVELAP